LKCGADAQPHHQPACQVAVVQLTAVNTCHTVGAVAALTDTVVVALFNQLATVAVQAIKLAAVQVTFVITQLAGVHKAGVTNVGEVANTGLPVQVGVLFFTNLPVVQLNKTGTASVAEAGHTTSQLQVQTIAVQSSL